MKMTRPKMIALENLPSESDHGLQKDLSTISQLLSVISLAKALKNNETGRNLGAAVRDLATRSTTLSLSSERSATQSKAMSNRADAMSNMSNTVAAATEAASRTRTRMGVVHPPLE